MTEEITLTEEQLQEKIDEQVKKAVAETTEQLKKEHNEEMARQRMKAKEEQKKAVESAVADANLSAEEKAKRQLEEERKADKEELERLRYEKKVNDRAGKLKENGLPDFFKNDSRLLNAEEDKVDEVIETIKKEYNEVIPKGATTDTNVHGTNSGKGSEKAELDRIRHLGLGK